MELKLGAYDLFDELAYHIKKDDGSKELGSIV